MVRLKRPIRSGNAPTNGAFEEPYSQRYANKAENKGRRGIVFFASVWKSRGLHPEKKNYPELGSDCVLGGYNCIF